MGGYSELTEYVLLFLVLSIKCLVLIIIYVTNHYTLVICLTVAAINCSVF